MMGTYKLLSVPCICRILLIFLGANRSDLHLSAAVISPNERYQATLLTIQLCAWVWIVKQQLLLMNAVTCTVWRYVEFTSKGTLFLISFFYFSVRKLGCLYASLTHCCWSCLLLIFCTSHPRCEWSRWAGIKEPALLLRHSLFTLWFVCI